MNSDAFENFVTIRNLHKSFLEGEVRTDVLKGIDMTISRGTFASIVGPSGCGKTTLLSLLGALDAPDRGKITVDGRDITALGKRERRQYRAEQTGYIFQFYNLMPTLTSLENVELGIEHLGLSADERRAQARSFLERVGLSDSLDKFPSQLSGGQQQRVAVARALARKPKLLLADEPTGNLDEGTGRQVFELIQTLQREENTTCLMVTHNLRQARATEEVFRLTRGRIDESADLEPTEELHQ